MLRYIIFAPLAGALINWLVGRRIRNEIFIGLVACGSVAVSTAFSFYLAFKPDGVLHSTAPVLDHLFTWISVGSFRADFGLAMDRLSAIYALFVTFVGLLIHIFAVGYMHGDSGYYRFFAYLNLFMFAMLTLVLADNFLLMFVGWEGVGLCSYLLIGYYLDRKEAAEAAKKAFIVNRVGDWGFVLGIMLVFFLTGSVSFFAKEEQGVASALQTIALMPAETFAWQNIFAGGITSLAVLLFIGAVGKSAQIPLYVWLPDAMAGPTPVSALIHAATMVTAGVYMIVRCGAIYTQAPTAMFIVAVIGASTALFAATIGLAQNDIKKVLAYSTISQLGYMFLACGVGAYIAAIFHVMTHAFFKALLFLGAGSVIHGTNHEQDLRRMGGLRKYMPVTFATMIAGWLAICGVPFFAGFFSKDEILWKVWSAHTEAITGDFGKVLWGIGALTALLTAVYMTRLMVMTFWGEERFEEVEAGRQADEAHAFDIGEKPHKPESATAGSRPHHEPDITAHKPHESPLVMTVPLVILAILSTAGGLVGVPYALSGGAIENYIEHALEPVVHPQTSSQEGGTTPQIQFLSPPPLEIDGAPAVGHTPAEAAAAETAHSPEEIYTERVLMAVSVALALIGIAVGFVVFRRRPLLRFPRLLEEKYYVDEVYDATIVRPIEASSREGLWKIFDLGVIDGLLHGIGRSIVQVGSVLRYLQIGFVRSYAAIILLGALAVIGYFAYVFVTSALLQ